MQITILPSILVLLAFRALVPGVIALGSVCPNSGQIEDNCPDFGEMPYCKDCGGEGHYDNGLECCTAGDIAGCACGDPS